MGLKDNFFQAMKELFGGESAGADVSAEKEAKGPSSLRSPQKQQNQVPLTTCLLSPSLRTA